MRYSTIKDKIKMVGVMVLVSVCAYCSADERKDNQRLEKLETRLSAYKEALRSNDYVKAASFVSPEMIHEIGGKENFAKLVQQFTDSTIIMLKPSLLDFSKPEKIVSYNNMYVSVITQTIPVTTEDVDEELKKTYLEFNPDFPARIFEGRMDGIFNLSLVAYSQDEGNTWFFTGGNIMGLRLVNIKPDILKKIRIPLPMLLFGEADDKVKLVRQRKRWVMNVSEISTAAGDESIIFTLGESMTDIQPDTAAIGMPDDSLDPYIYLEEHTDILSDVLREPAQPARGENLMKGEAEDDVSQNDSQSVFVTRTSNTYHRADCIDLGEEDLLEFMSSREALDAGGVPCNRCKP